MKIPELNSFSPGTRLLVNSVLTMTGRLDWPRFARMCRTSMRADMSAVSPDEAATMHIHLACLFNRYLGPRHILPDAEQLNELWNALFRDEYHRLRMDRLEKEIDMSDLRLVPLGIVRSMFDPYGFVICLEKTGTLRIQPWDISQVEPEKHNRYYVRASQSKAVIRGVRMLDSRRMSLDDIERALAVITEKNPGRGDRLQVDLTNC